MSQPASIAQQQRQRNWAWIWLVYTGFLFVTPMLEPTRILWLGTLGVFAIYLVLFFRYVVSSDQGDAGRHGMILATFVLGLFTFPWNQGGSTFFIYAACFLSFNVPSVRKVLALFALESLLVLAEGYYLHSVRGFLHVPWPNTLIAIFLILIIGGGNIFLAEQKRADCKLRAAQDENLALAAVAERERIARDLHDVLGHTLSVIVLKAELAGRLIQRNQPSDHERAAAEIADVERIARTSLAEVREAIGGYRARGLSAEIEAARLTLDAAGVTVLIDDADAPVAGLLSAAEETALSLALREAVTNIVRHAHASTCRLGFAVDGSHRRLFVQDDGHHAIAREGNGLRGMRHRIESVGGQLLLERDHGTRLLIELPHRTPPHVAVT